MNKLTNVVSEAVRIKALEDLRILDTLPEAFYQDMVTLAASICNTPICAISLVDKERQWFKASVGLKLRETPRDISLCTHTILSDDIMHIPDSHADSRFADSPLVKGETNFRFYAGAPLIVVEGIHIGTICVMDHVPRELTDVQKQALRIIARQVIEQIGLSRKLKELEESQTLIRDQKIQLDTITENIPGAIYQCELTAQNQLRVKYLSQGARRLFQLKDETSMSNFGDFSKKTIHPLDQETFETKLTNSAKNFAGFQWEGRLKGGNGTYNWVRLTSTPRMIENVLNWDGIIIDINYEKTLEDEIHRERRHTAEALKTSAFGKLATRLAHEINNPLAIIKGLCFVVNKKLQKSAVPPAVIQHDLESIDFQANRIKNITSFLQHFANSNPSVPFESTTVQDVIDLALSYSEHSLQKAKIKIELTNASTSELVCRKVIIARSLANLIENSCEAVGESPDAWVRIETQEKEEYAEILVRDSGLGISEDHVPFLTDPFFTTKNVSDGRGHGLATAKAAAEEHGGRLFYDSRAQNTTFVLVLPLQNSVEKKLP